MSQRTYSLPQPLHDHIRVLEKPVRTKRQTTKRTTSRLLTIPIRTVASVLLWTKQILSSAIIVSILLFIVVNFYIFA